MRFLAAAATCSANFLQKTSCAALLPLLSIAGLRKGHPASGAYQERSSVKRLCINRFEIKRLPESQAKIRM